MAMNCGGCIRGGYRLAFLEGGQFCMIPCDTEPPPVTPPTVSVVNDTSDPTGMTVKMTILTNAGDGPVTVDWGDSTPVIDPVAVGQEITHQYANAGTYVVKVTSKADPAAFVTVQVTVPAMPTWEDVPLKWDTWSDVDVATWADMATFTPAG